MALLATIAVLASGLYGTVTKGPTTPVCRAGQPCSAPAQVTLLFRPERGSTRTTRVHTDARGHYRVLLAPGTYAVSTVERIGVSRNIRPRLVHVRPSHVDRLDFAIDTGIR